MILNTEVKNPVTTSDDFTEYEYSIKDVDMGIILDILRSKMYQNPIAAICREISCNARDANREVGNHDPIEISIENSPIFNSDICISFKDQGPGISPERMADVFVNYGSSTKRDTNEQTGAFGLGAKTPFSYGDNYSIITTVGGYTYTYVAAIEDNSKGKIYLLSKEKSQEESGTNILVPIKNERDRATFERESRLSTYWWEKRPIYNNFLYDSDQMSKPVVKLRKKDFIIIKNRSYFHNGILIDGVFYKSDNVSINDIYNSHCNIILVFKVGEISISATRESIHYDEMTLSAIEKKKSVVISYAVRHINKIDKSLVDYVDKWQIKEVCCNNRLLLGHLYHMIPKTKKNSLNFLYKDKDKKERLPTSFRNIFSYLNLYLVKKIDLENDRWNILEFNSLSGFFNHVIDYDVNEEKSFFKIFPVYLNDTKIGRPKTIFRTILKNNDIFILFSCLNADLRVGESDDENKLKGYLKDVSMLTESGIKYTKFSDVPKTKKKRESKKSEKKYKIKKIPVKIALPNRKEFDILSVDLDLSKDKLYFSNGANEISIPFDRCFYQQVKDLRCMSSKTITKSIKKLLCHNEVLGQKKVIIYARKNIDIISKYMRDVSNIDNSISKKELYLLKDISFYVNRDSSDEIESNIKFNYKSLRKKHNKIKNRIKKIRKFKKINILNSYRFNKIVSVYEYKDSLLFKRYRDLKKSLGMYPLLKYFSRHSSLSVYQQYIDAMDIYYERKGYVKAKRS